MVTAAFKIQVGDWAGGRNYFANLFAAVRTLPARRVEPVIITGSKDAARMRTDFPETQVLSTPLLQKGAPEWMVRRATARLTSNDLFLSRFLSRQRISVLSHYSGKFSERVETPMIAWIPDFQHIHLPEFFTAAERESRDRNNLTMCINARTIILSSEVARKHLEGFAPQYVPKAKVLPFVASPTWSNSTRPIAEQQRKYSFNEPYVLLPNQFWAHKNHRLVISALKILKSRNQRVLVLATGLPSDYRNPTFYSELMEFAETSQVLDSFRPLGMIPLKDLSILMFNAVAILNPSRFEGWSTSVEEAKSIGKRVLLSDIPVHREQNPAPATYFHPDDAEGLASALWAAYQDFNASTDLEEQKTARARLLGRQQDFARTYENIVLSSLASASS